MLQACKPQVQQATGSLAEALPLPVNRIIAELPNRIMASLNDSAPASPAGTLRYYSLFRNLLS